MGHVHRERLIEVNAGSLPMESVPSWGDCSVRNQARTRPFRGCILQATLRVLPAFEVRNDPWKHGKDTIADRMQRSTNTKPLTKKRLPRTALRRSMLRVGPRSALHVTHS